MNFFEVYFSGKYTVTMYQRKLRFTFNEATQQLRYGNRSPKKPLEWLFDNTSIIRPIESE